MSGSSDALFNPLSLGRALNTNNQSVIEKAGNSSRFAIMNGKMFADKGSMDEGFSRISDSQITKKIIDNDCDGCIDVGHFYQQGLQGIFARGRYSREPTTHAQLGSINERPRQAIAKPKQS